MLEKMNVALSKEYNIHNDFKLTGYAVIARLIVYLVSTSWVIFYPSFLLLIHMKEEKFFSYDIFFSGIFGVNVFTISLFIVISIISFGMWSGTFLLARRIYWKVKRNKSAIDLGCNNKPRVDLVSCMLLFIASIFFHGIVWYASITTGDWGKAGWVYILTFLFAIIFARLVTTSWQGVLINWKFSLVAIIVSALAPIFLSPTFSDITKVGLQQFNVGGGMPVVVKRISDNSVVESGALLLLAPRFIYIRSEDDGLDVFSRSNNIYLDIGRDAKSSN
ncbi:hypothetical protein [Cobetia amphilecti]|uniref:hypothetical protein n=1 Tax=Cobetia amphilecti TaxID=1055104 RepID=UPI0026E212BE|nr:hypothetical protein [Cobetia amphilecti]MDO6815977.1 hypothetical protein [Cobetia amphilecti]